MRTQSSLPPSPEHAARSGGPGLPNRPTAGSAPDRRAGWRTRHPRSEAAAWFTLSLLLLLVVWHLVVVVGGLPRIVLPPPVEVLREVVERRALLWQHGLITVRDVLISFGLAVLLGVPFATLLSLSRVLERLMYPLLVVSQAVPKVAIAPLLLIWFGFGSTTNILLGVSIAIFPIIVNVMLGLTEIDDDFLKLGRVMGATPTRLFWRIRLPHAVPSLFAGMKLAITFAVIGTVVGEFFAGSRGLGYLAQSGAGALDTTLTFASIVVLSVLSIVLFYLVVALEYVSLGWRRDV